MIGACAEIHYIHAWISSACPLSQFSQNLYIIRCSLAFSWSSRFDGARIMTVTLPAPQEALTLAICRAFWPVGLCLLIWKWVTDTPALAQWLNCTTLSAFSSNVFEFRQFFWAHRDWLCWVSCGSIHVCSHDQSLIWLEEKMPPKQFRNSKSAGSWSHLVGGFLKQSQGTSPCHGLLMSFVRTSPDAYDQ